MPSDVDEIIGGVQADHPEVEVTRMVKSRPADDDHLWFFRLPTVMKDIHIESATEDCPFWIEHLGMKSGAESVVANTVEEGVRWVSNYLAHLKASPPP